MARRIGLALCHAGNGEILPKGTHLRWFVSRLDGPPKGGFEVLHLSSTAWRQVRESLAVHVGFGGSGSVGAPAGSNDELRYQPHPSLAIHFRPSTELKLDNGSLVVGSTGSDQHLLLRFAEPVLFLRLKLRGVSGGPPIQAFHHSARLLSTPIDDEVVEIETPAITDVLLPLAMERVEQISFVREIDVAALKVESQIDRLATVATPGSAGEALEALATYLPSGIDNRMLRASTVAEMLDRYPEAKVTTLIDYLQRTVDQAGATIDGPVSVGQSPRRLRVLDHLNLAALDPNVARLLGWSFVDGAGRDGLFVLRALHGPKPDSWGHGFAFAHQRAAAPSLDRPVVAEQLPGIKFDSDKAFGRIGISWERARQDLSSLQRTVFIDVHRLEGRTDSHLTADRPHVVSAGTGIVFTDEEVPVDRSYHYVITPVDIFGRTGDRVEVGPVAVRKLLAPVPPRRLTAVVEQHGYPWTDPATHREPDILAGIVSATAEWGAAQRIAAPDAATLTWYWRTRPSNQNGATGDWTALHTSEIPEPTNGMITLDADRSVANIQLRVAEIRSLDTITDQARLDRLADAVPDVSDRDRVPSGLLEILLDEPLLEPGGFDGYQLADTTVIGTHAGVASTDDRTPDAKRTARLIVDDSPAVRALAGQEWIAVTNPTLSGLGIAQLRELLRGAGPEPDDPAGAVTPIARLSMGKVQGIDQKTGGGELAIEHRTVRTPDGPKTVESDESEADVALITGRVISTPDSAAGALAFLVRFTLRDLVLLRLAELEQGKIERQGWFHAPIPMPRTTIGVRGNDGDIRLDLDDDQRFCPLWITATATDRAGVESPQVATPAELRVVNPPRVVVPPAPYPTGESSTTTVGSASFPNGHGRATVRVSWDAMAGAGVRYELARALDTSIVAAAQQRWLRGQNDPLPVTEPAAVQGAFAAGQEVAAAGNGSGNGRSIRLRTAPLPAVAVQALLQAASGPRRGRIAVTHTIDQTPILRHHRLLGARRDADDIVPGDDPANTDDGSGRVVLQCQPHVAMDDLGEIDSSVPFVVQSAPEFDAILGDDQALRQLADAMSGGDAPGFGVTTGSPVTTNDYVDEIPGSGRNRYFYKVRAVFPGETRSTWSAASVAFHQVDLSVAEPPRIVSVDRRQGTFRLTVRRPVGQGVEGLRLETVTDETNGTPVTLEDWLFDPPPGGRPLPPAPIRATGRVVDRRVSGVGTVALVHVHPIGPDGQVDTGTDLLNQSEQRSDANPAVLLTTEPAGPVALAVGDGPGQTSIVSEHADLVEIELANDPDSNRNGSLRLRTLRSVTAGDGTVRLDSPSVEVR